LSQGGDDLLASRRVAAAGAAERLAEGAGEDVDAAQHATVLVGAAAALAEDAHRVGVVDHHHGVVALRQVADLGQRRDDAVHGEDAVGGDETDAGAGGLLEARLQVVHVGVAVAQPSRLAEPHAVD